MCKPTESHHESPNRCGLGKLSAEHTDDDEVRPWLKKAAKDAQDQEDKNIVALVKKRMKRKQASKTLADLTDKRVCLVRAGERARDWTAAANTAGVFCCVSIVIKPKTTHITLLPIRGLSATGN